LTSCDASILFELKGELFMNDLIHLQDELQAVNEVFTRERKVRQ
jgi:hypothetical protein